MTPPSPSSAGQPATRRWISVAEFEDVVVPLADVTTDGEFDFYPDALSGGLFSARLDRDRLVIQPRAFVGWISLNDRLGLDVGPRVPISDLDRLLTRSGAAPKEFRAFTRRYATIAHDRPSFRDAIARALLRALEPIEHEGILRRYEQVTRQTSFPKGRIRPYETAVGSWAQGRRDRVTATWFERNEDIGPNQVIRLAIHLVARMYQHSQATKGGYAILSELNRADRVFARVEPTSAGLNDSDVQDPDRLPNARAYYRPALELAKTIVSRRTVQLGERGDEVELPSLLFKLDDAFEDYLRGVLSDGLSAFAPTYAVMSGRARPPSGGQRPLFDDTSNPSAEPDVVVLRDPSSSREAVLVVEVKYMDRTFNREELEQVIAYSAAYRCPAVLVRPRRRLESPSGITPIGTIGDIALSSFVFDLGATDLDHEERRFVAAIRRYLVGDNTSVEAA